MSSISNKIANFRQRRDDWGLRRALYWQLMHAIGKYLGVRIHYVAVGDDLSVPAEAERPDVPSEYDTRIVGLADLLPYVDRVPGLDAEFLHAAFARGDECAANFLGDELVGFGFIGRSRARVTDQLDVLIPQGFRYSYKDWTHDDHRRRNLTKMRGYVRFTTLPRSYHEREIWFVETHNYISLLHRYTRPTRRAVRMGYCGWWSVFGRQIPFNTRHAKWIGLEIVRKSDDGLRQYF